jgi:ATP-dependent DNA helicase RecG
LYEHPPGRKPVKTYFFPKDMFWKCISFIKQLLEDGRQIFFVYPLVKESEKMALKAATVMYERLVNIFPKQTVGLIHGQMPPKQKDSIMQKFRQKEIHLLVATTVIEVGIDVPDATVMVIENAERYGLSTLHQLRGRISRGSKEGICIVFGDPKTPQATQRLKIFLKTTDGFRIAEEDIKIRGTGEFFGTRQSGLPDLKIADILKDQDMLFKARQDVLELVRRGEQIEPFLYELTRRFKKSPELLFVG